MENDVIEPTQASDSEIMGDDVVEEQASPDTVWDMDDDTFNDALESTGNVDEPVVEEEVVELSLGDRYDAQRDVVDGKLDQPILLKHNGEVIEIDNILELKNLAERGFNPTKKLEQLADTKARLEAQYAEQGIDKSVSDVDVVADSILNSGYAGDFTDVVGVMPESVKSMVSGDANMLKSLAIDVESGLVDAATMSAIDRTMSMRNMDFKQAYMTVINERDAKPTEQDERVESSRKTLQSQPKNTQVSTSSKSAWDMSDAEFEKQLANL